MENKLVKTRSINYLYFFVIGAFLLVTGQLMFAKYMFMDGLYYTTIARNLAVGDGSVWDLKFTNTVFTHFHEHPPLAMWLESLCFKVFGTSWFIDKMYTVSTYVFSGFVIHKIWRVCYPSSGLSWATLLFWLFTPVVFWAVNNNMLENTLTIFLLSSIFFSLRTVLTGKPYYPLLAGLFIALGFLTKGFVALFPLSFFGVYLLIFKEYTFKTAIKDTALLVIGMLVPLGMLFLFNQDAYLSIKAYFNIQVVNSLNNIVTVESRFFIVKRLLSELLVIFSLLLLLFIFSYKKKFPFSRKTLEFKWFLFFSSLGLTGVLPILISLKQSGFYILPTYPLFAIGFVSLFKDRITFFHQQIVDSIYTKYVSIILFMGGLTLALSSIGSYGKDEKLVKDVEVISRYLKKGEVVGASTSMIDDFSIHGYLYRFNFISIHCDNAQTSKYFLLNMGESSEANVPLGYKLVSLHTEILQLYTKK